MPSDDHTRIKIACRNCRTHLDVSDLEPFSRMKCPMCGTSLRIPLKFGPYLLEKLCGSGGMANVYRAIDVEHSRRVAVKVLNREAEADGVNVAEFIDGAKMLARFKHPGIIEVYDCGVYDSRAFIVMQYMPYGSMSHHLRVGSLPPLHELLREMAVISDALNYTLREFSVVHHDIKPANILLGENEARLTDFDLADVRAKYDEQTMCDEFGSPAYMSPERLYAGGEDFRGDVFSLGMTIYELLAGTPPFKTEGDPETLLERRVDGIFTPLCEVLPGVDKALSSLVGKMISFAPELRPEYDEITAVLLQAAENCRPAEPGEPDNTAPHTETETSVLARLFNRKK